MIGDEHPARGMGNHQRRFAVKRYRLGCNPAGPKHWLFPGPHLDRVTEVGVAQVQNADGRRVPDVNRRAVGGGKAGGDLHRADDLLPFDRPHADHHGPGKDTCGNSGHVGDVHGHVGAIVLVAQPNPRVDHGRLEGEATA